MPGGRQIDLMGGCVVGTAGCRYLLDEMFNTITRFRCGQQTEVDYRPNGDRRGRPGGGGCRGKRSRMRGAIWKAPKSMGNGLKKLRKV